MDTNDDLITTAGLKIESAIEALNKLRQNYEATNDSPGDDDDPERVDMAIIECESALGTINDLVP